MSFTLESAMKFVNDLEDEKIEIKACDLFNESGVLKMIDVQPFQKDSSSPTEIMFAKLTSKLVKGRFELPISLKVFSNEEDDKDPDIGGLFYEYRMYKLITDLIVRTGVCPNFIPYIAFGCCEDEKCYLITEKAGNGMQFGKNKIYPIQTLAEIYPELSLREKQQVLFQIVYALTVMQRFKISHNDLHSNNILVMIMDEPVIMKYIADKKVFKIQTKYIPYIYDWDLGSHTLLGKNPKLDTYFREEINITGEFMDIRDIYTLFCYLGIDENQPYIVSSYTKHPMLVQKEDKQRYEVGEKRIRWLRMYMTPNRVINGIAVYKLSRAEFRSLVSDTIEIPLYMKDVYIIPYSKSIDIWSPFYCRVTSTSTTFQTPEQFLMNNFKMFESNQAFDTPFTYRLPSAEQVDLMLDIFATQNPNISELLYDYFDDKDKESFPKEIRDAHKVKS